MNSTFETFDQFQFQFLLYLLKEMVFCFVVLYQVSGALHLRKRNKTPGFDPVVLSAVVIDKNRDH